MNYRIEAARNAEDLDAACRLFREYADRLGIDLAFQGFDAELAQLPGKYAPPGGDLLLAHGAGGETLGCVGLRPLEIPGACEVKRLYVRSTARGDGVGRALMSAIVERATALGYREMMLDTLPTMISAIAIHRALGFAPIAPYWDNPVPGILYFGKHLQLSAPRTGSCRNSSRARRR